MACGKLLVLLAGLVAVCSAGLVPAAVPAALTVGTYATSYNAHAVNHAVAAPYIASPVIAHAAAAPLAYSAHAAAAPLAYSAYTALHPAPAAAIIAGRR